MEAPKADSTEQLSIAEQITDIVAILRTMLSDEMFREEFKKMADEGKLSGASGVANGSSSHGHETKQELLDKLSNVIALKRAVHNVDSSDSGSVNPQNSLGAPNLEPADPQSINPQNSLGARKLEPTDPQSVNPQNTLGTPNFHSNDPQSVNPQYILGAPIIIPTGPQHTLSAPQLEPTHPQNALVALNFHHSGRLNTLGAPKLDPMNPQSVMQNSKEFGEPALHLPGRPTHLLPSKSFLVYVSTFAMRPLNIANVRCGMTKEFQIPIDAYPSFILNYNFGIQTLSCAYCPNKIFNTIADAYNHSSKEHRDRPFSCKLLYKGENSLPSDYIISCGYCKWFGLGFRVLFAHIQARHRFRLRSLPFQCKFIAYALVMKIKCLYCDKKIAFFNSFKSHMSTDHKPYFVCSGCGMTADDQESFLETHSSLTAEELRNHVIYIQEDEEVPNDDESTEYYVDRVIIYFLDFDWRLNQYRFGRP